VDRSAAAARALASEAGRRAVETGDAGALIRIVREAFGWKQADLGRETGYSQPTISRLEKGQGRISDLDVRAHLADVLAIPRSAVGLLGTNSRPAEERNVGDMRRSDFLRGMVGAAASLALPMEITSSEPTRIGMSTVRGCSAALDRLYELDERHGGSTIFALATRMVTDLRSTLARASYSAQVGRELRCVAAATAEHAGWLAFDAGRVSDARHWWLEAMHFADLADDHSARVTALASMALQACTAKDPLSGREAVDLMDLAKRSAGAALTPRLTSLISARQAIGYARIGDKDAAVKAMAAAERSLGAGTPEDNEPTWLNFWGPADLSCHQARTFLALGKPAEAERFAALALDACDEAVYPRNHTIYAAVRATALLQDRRVDDAISAATPVVARVSTLGSRRIVAETQSLVSLLGNYRTYGPAASFTAWTNTLLAAA
jgi:transcriptional regulator with XRE-family HTH domain